MSDHSLYNADYHRRILAKYLSNNTYSRDKNANLLELVQPGPGDNILEIGCSSGATCFLCASNGSRITGIDLDPEAIKVAEEALSTMPELYGSCNFAVGNADELIGKEPFNKVIMIDFTEHVEDGLLSEILRSVSSKSQEAALFIYTPNRRHIFEVLKGRNILLKKDPSHIALRDMGETTSLIETSGLRVTRRYTRPSHVPVFRALEMVLSRIPLLGGLFQRRICIQADVPKPEVREGSIESKSV